MRHVASSSGWASCLSWGISLLCALIIGYFVGAIHEAGRERIASPMHIVNGTGALFPVVDIRAWRSGTLEVHVTGETRLFVEGKSVGMDADGSFRIVPKPKAAPAAQVATPDGMHFVASKKGKKYYPVDSSAGKALSPANRVYFADSAAAEAAGYVK